VEQNVKAMKTKFENVLESIIDVSRDFNTNKESFHVTVVSNQHAMKHVAPYVHERFSYIGAQAGTPGVHPNIPGYQTYAVITLVYSHDRNEYELIEDYRGLGGEFRKIPVTCSEETLASDYAGVVEQFMQRIA
jgi:hypothetical protein